MSLNDQILEGDYYDTHILKYNNMKPKKSPDEFEEIADYVTKDLFTKKSTIRRIYESVKTTLKRRALNRTRKH